jgi:3-oxoacyl-[acyl-carrier protein] reductase
MLIYNYLDRYKLTCSSINRNYMIIFLSGATSGIGKSLLEDFVKNNFTVIICSKTASKFKKKNFKNNKNIHAFDANFSDLEEVNNLAIKIKKKFKKIDVIINNAGGVETNKTFLNTNYKDYLNIFNLNLFSTIFIIKNLYPLMNSSKFKQIINISSIAAKRPGYFNPGYAASKSSLNNITKYLANFMANKKILVNTISPGVVDTKGFRRNLIDISKIKKQTVRKILEIEKNKIPLKKFGKPEDILKLVNFLIFENKWMTGSNILIDGGKIETVD